MARYRHRKRLIAEINVVPYIDVMLVLLIIFMITAPMSNLTQGVEVDLPTANSEPVVSDSDVTPIIIHITHDEKYLLSYVGYPSQEISFEKLLLRIKALLQKQPKNPILIGADKNIPHDTVITLMGKLQDHDVNKVGIITKSNDEE